MVSLLARLPRRGGAGQAPLPLGWLAVAAAVAVNLAGLAGLSLALVVVQTLDPAGGLGTGSSIALAGRLWLLAQGGELDVGAGPIVLAPLLLTLGIAWGLSRAGRGLARLLDLTAGADAARAAGLVVAVHLLLTLVLALAARRPGRRGRAAADRRGCRRPRRRSRSAGGSAGSRACSTRRWTGCPAPRARCCAVCSPDCSRRWPCAPPSSPSRWPPTPAGYATLSGSLGGAAAGALGLLGLGAAAAAERRGRRARARRRARLLRRLRHPRVGARRDARRRARASRCWPRSPTPRPCR